MLGIMQGDAITILLFIIAMLNGAYLIGQKNQRDDMKALAEKLEHWIIEFTELKGEHKSRTAKECERTDYPRE